MEKLYYDRIAWVGDRAESRENRLVSLLQNEGVYPQKFLSAGEALDTLRTRQYPLIVTASNIGIGINHYKKDEFSKFLEKSFEDTWRMTEYLINELRGNTPNIDTPIIVLDIIMKKRHKISSEAKKSLLQKGGTKLVTLDYRPEVKDIAPFLKFLSPI